MGRGRSLPARRRGLGKVFAAGLAQRGFNLVLVARRREALETVAREIGGRYGRTIEVIDLDLGHPDAPARLDAATQHLDVGLLVAAAGYGSSGPLLDADLANELSMIDLNCRSVLAQTALFAKRFIKRRRSGIVLMGSLVGWQGAPGAANYAATKAYIQALAEGLELEMAGQNIDVLSVAPGPVHSGFAARAGMRMSLAASPQVVADGALKRLGSRGTVIPGLLSKFLTTSLRALPRNLRVKMMGRIMAAMVRHRYGSNAQKTS